MPTASLALIRVFVGKLARRNVLASHTLLRNLSGKQTITSPILVKLGPPEQKKKKLLGHQLAEQAGDLEKKKT